MNPLIRTGILIVAVVIACGIGWGQISKVVARASTARAHATELRAKLASAEADESRAKTARKKIEELRLESQKLDLSYIAPPDIPLVWAQSEIKNRASDAGVEILTLIESTARPPAGREGGGVKSDMPPSLPVSFSFLRA